MNKNCNQKWLYDLTPQEVQFFADAALSNPDKNIQQRTVLQVRNKYKFARDPYPLSVGSNNRTFAQQNIITNDILSSIKLYPNPSSENVKIEIYLGNDVDQAFVMLQNTLGQVIKKQVVNRNQLIIEINLADIENGIYYITLVGDNGVLTTEKLIVIK